MCGITSYIYGHQIAPKRASTDARHQLAKVQPREISFQVQGKPQRNQNLANLPLAKQQHPLLKKNFTTQVDLYLHGAQKSALGIQESKQMLCDGQKIKELRRITITSFAYRG